MAEKLNKVLATRIYVNCSHCGNRLGYRDFGELKVQINRYQEVVVHFTCNVCSFVSVAIIEPFNKKLELVSDIKPPDVTKQDKAPKKKKKASSFKQFKEQVIPKELDEGGKDEK